ncbi:MAG: dihydrolipoyl dehydrogenase [Bacteroidota bacterium]
MSKRQEYDVVVIGGGPGGYAAAFKAADLQLKVALVDPEENPGGVCLYRGCIPSKALLHLVKLKKEAEEAKKIGLDFGKAKVNLDKVREWKDQVITNLTSGLGQLSKQRKIEYIRGFAEFKDEHTLEINNDQKQKISFKNAIIATGSRAIAVPDLNADSDRVMFAEQALNLEEIPESLLVIGGGYIGLEIGTVYQLLGARVTIAEMTDSLMPGADPDLIRIYSKTNKDFFSEVRLNTKVIDLEESGNKVLITFQVKENQHESQGFDKVLMAIGRKPNTENLNLQSVSVDTDEKGFIKVNKQRKTSQPNVYAIGDVAGEPMLAHKATHEGIIAAEVIAGANIAYEPKAIPAVVFTDPEIAWCGLTEVEAKKQKKEIKILKFPWAASGRAQSLGRSDGLTKLIVEPETERVLGVGIVGLQAGDMIAEGVLAVEMAALAKDLALSIHPHPTLSETIMEAAEQLYGSSTHFKK